ncbi:MAG: hypothetical protein N2049_08955 [Anaerolineales bacterium]|nr:hypothetical protein [Anaerolineales bacterium]
MNKILKWFLILLAVLLVVGGIVFVWHLWPSYGWGGYTRWGHPMMHGWRPHFDGWHGPMIFPRAFFPFGGLLFSGLLKWLFLAALLYGAYWLGKRSASASTTTAPPPSVSSPSAPAVPPAPSAETSEAQR